MTRTTSRLALATITLVAIGCQYRPAVFADRPVVMTVDDDAPIPVPSRRDVDETTQVSDVYFRRPLFDVVHPVEFPTAGDVNAVDEVPPSSWYDPTGTPSAASPPMLPVTAVDEDPLTHPKALVVRDARGQRYELIGDPPGHPGLATGSDVVAGHLLRALGLRTPSAWIVDIPDVSLGHNGDAALARLDVFRARQDRTDGWPRRLSATRWPEGIDVGTSGDFMARGDDANDRVPHRDRRTLRAMRVFAHWLGWSSFSEHTTRDVYVGSAGSGHLLHHLVGMSSTLGAGDAWAVGRRERDPGLLVNLVTLGLSTPTWADSSPSRFPSVGSLSPLIEPGTFDVTPPYSPFVRLTPADEYWAAKRLVDAIDEPVAIAAARLPDDAARHLATVLRMRRRALVEHAFRAVSPLDPAATSGRAVWLRDRALVAHLVVADETRYQIDLLDGNGASLARTMHKNADGPELAVVIPDRLSGRVVLHVRVTRSGVEAPRACDVHLVVEGDSLKIIGVRHLGHGRDISHGTSDADLVAPWLHNHRTPARTTTSRAPRQKG